MKIATPATNPVPNGPFGNGRLADSGDLARLYRSAAENPENYLRLLDAYPIAHDPHPSIYDCALLALPMGLNAPNVLFFGRSGSGKTQKGTLPAVANAIGSGWSFVYVNVKGKGQTRIVRKIAELFGRNCETIAPRKPDRTLGWTALDGCQDLPVAGEVAACMVACAAGRSRYGEGAWTYNQTQEWIQHGIAAICTDLPKANQNLLELRRIVLAGDYNSFAENHPDFPALKKFARYEEGGNRNAETIAATISEATSFIDDISPFLSKAELSLDAFAEQGGCLIVEIDEYDVDRLRPLLTLLLGRLIATLQKHACNTPTRALASKNGHYHRRAGGGWTSSLNWLRTPHMPRTKLLFCSRCSINFAIPGDIRR